MRMCYTTACDCGKSLLMGRDCGPSDRNNSESDGDCNTHALRDCGDLTDGTHAPRDCGCKLRMAIRYFAVGSGDSDCSYRQSPHHD